MKRLVLVAALALGCASIQQVPYTLQPARIPDPKAEITNFIKLNTVSNCIAEPEFAGQVLSVRFVCSGGLGQAVARLDRVQSITVEQSGDWYRVLLKHSPGIEDFAWSSKSLEDVQRAADAFEALVHPTTDGKAAGTTTM